MGKEAVPAAAENHASGGGTNPGMKPQEPPGRRVYDFNREHGGACDSLVAMLQTLARARGHSTAVSFWARGEEAHRLSYQALWNRARGAARSLQAGGIAAGDRTLLILGTSPDFLAYFFGTLVAGGVTVPVAPPPSLRNDIIGHYVVSLQRLVRDCGARACVVEPRLLPLLRERLHAELPALRLLAPDANCDPCPESAVASPTAGETALLQYTSGSTSKPKGVELTHGNLLSNIAAIERALGRQPGDVTVSWLPLYHDMGLIGTLLTSLYAAVPVVLLTPAEFAKHPLRWLQAISKTHGTISAAPNFAFGYLLSRVSAEALRGLALGQLRVVLNGAEPVDAGLIDAFEARLAPAGLRPGTLLPVYGLAESALAVAFGERGQRVLDQVDAERLERKHVAEPTRLSGRSRTLVSVGRPLPTQTVRIVGEAGEALAERQVGEITVCGPSVMKGYINGPCETARVLRDGWLYTGDLGYLAEGRLFITGRKRDIIIRHGRNHYPEDLEAPLRDVDGVQRGAVAVFGVPVGTDVHLVVVAETKLKGHEPRDVLARRIRERLAGFGHIPVHEVVLAEPGALPRTTSGKLRRQVCRSIYLSADFDSWDRSGLQSWRSCAQVG